MSEYFSRYWFDFVYTITRKEIKVRYKRVFFGFLWVVLNPIIQMLVIGYIFQFFVFSEINNYFYFLFAGLLPWNFFSYTLTKCTPLMLNERHLIQKAKFPRETLVLSIVLSNFFHFLISLGLYLALSIFITSFSFIKIIVLFVVSGWMLAFVSGISLLFSTLFVKFRDIKFIVQAVVPLWFYATPIIYTTDLLPENVRFYINLNPMTGIVDLFHYVFIDNMTFPNVQLLFISFLISAVIFVMGIYSFMKESPYFDDWL